jgi:glycosyltransferase involved in cell wall biosynthesis
VRKLLLVSQRPQEYGGVGSTRWNAFREYLPQFGWEVAVVTARPNPTANEYAADPGQQRAYAARAAVMGRAGAVLRPFVRRVGIEPEALAPSALWAVTGRRAVRAAIAEQRPDAVLATSPPIAGHLVTAGMRLGVPLVCEIRDNWAGNPYYDAGGRLLTRIERRALSGAAAIVTVSDPVADVVRRLHPPLANRVRVVSNGFDPVVLEERADQRTKSADPVQLIHAGPIVGYPGRTVEPLLTALREPALRGRCRLVLLGPAVTPEAGGVDVEVRPPVPWRESVRAQAAADIGVVLHSSDPTARSVKLYELLALGVPVLALVEPGDATDTLLRELGQEAGCARHGDPADIAAAIRRLMEDPPAPVAPAALQPFNREALAGSLAALLDGLVA